MVGYTQTAPTVISVTPKASSKSCLTGDFALAHSRCTFPSVSSPESVVRSMQVIAFSNQAACHSFLTVLLPAKVATRRSTALLFTLIAFTHSRSGLAQESCSWSNDSGKDVSIVLITFI